ncbi:MAG: hypothetical protein GEV08_02315 [Acidimicrobiia bacterium]|nr:hypothetical protein [Acidimicrobiia bacterium]
MKLTRYTSEYPGTEHPLAVRRLAAAVRVAAQRLLDVLDGALEVPTGHVVVVVADGDGPTVESRPLPAPVPLSTRRPRPARPARARPA